MKSAAYKGVHYVIQDPTEIPIDFQNDDVFGVIALM
jgi:hypothetical protein